MTEQEDRPTDAAALDAARRLPPAALRTAYAEDFRRRYALLVQDTEALCSGRGFVMVKPPEVLPAELVGDQQGGQPAAERGTES